ncbi:MAG: FtsW/RodA/SpoVE family cell cycle protein [Acidobacteriota bacterium]|nr:FtsW/RodA/SpoVE family cell cycle protein [Acidobacteriota bacterium]MDE3030109.1 FtsW/RodA/SpoVE family cell cycle protein [Acidobacteriota bacterium]MDE3092289.1 FtsW/RodA/SpoVE family cell cycle protein [Acidobacteriota bacterium]
MARHRRGGAATLAAPAPARESHSRSTELGLMFLAWVIVTAFYVLMSLATKGHVPARLDVFLGVVISVSLAMHVAIRRYAPRASQVLLPVATLLNGIGYVEIARWDPTEAGYQSLWFVVSALIVVVTLKLVKSIRDLDRYRYLTLAAAMALMLAPLTPHFGRNINGARLWLALGPLSFQPIEVAKILLVFFFASYFAANRELLSTPTQRFAGRLIVPPKVLVPILVAWGVALLILGGENDIGFAMMLFALFFAMLWVTTGLKSYLALGLALFAGGAVIADQLFSQVQARVSFWLDPWSATNFYHSSQLALGWFSLAAGGVAGTGLGLGQSGNIPAITSDMIFAALGEELGFVGIILILSLFAVFVGEGFRIAQRSHSDFVRLTATGLTATIGLQSFFIMAGILRLIPFTGITLPFVAYGGSSLFANYLIVALLLRISHENAQQRRGGEVVAVSFD